MYNQVQVALIGNPNVGKSTVFNALTGLKQHTGNWPGKTVELAQGAYTYKGKDYSLIDLPGAYSLFSCSEEERISAEYIFSGQADCTIIVVDATCLERNLNLALQILSCTDQAVLCVNLMDEAQRTGVEIDLHCLEHRMGVPVVATAAGSREGMERLKETVRNLIDGFLPLHPPRLLEERELICSVQRELVSDHVSQLFSDMAADIAGEAVCSPNETAGSRLDRIVLGRWSGRFILFGLLLLVFWLTIWGASLPTELLQMGFERLGRYLQKWMEPCPWWLRGVLLDGIYSTGTRVIAVMLPPMVIFFPLFTFLEDLGYLPRAAFLMDRLFQRCGSCGKQVLTMSMGFGCNAIGVTGCRIFSSPKERLVAIVTNALVPCNGRFPVFITLSTLFLAKHSWGGACAVTVVVFGGVIATLVTTGMLHHLLPGETAPFILELPKYRKPNLKKILVRSLLDRVVFVLGRAAAVAMPAGAVIWLLQHVSFGGQLLMYRLVEWLQPVGTFLGMDGVILLAFILSLPANELLLPLILMLLGSGSAEGIGQILLAGGWTWKTAVCTMVFTLFHWPCSTTCLTIRKETGSWKWVGVAALLPTVIGVLLCVLIRCL